jgi:hypothetical protein
VLLETGIRANSVKEEASSRSHRRVWHDGHGSGHNHVTQQVRREQKMRLNNKNVDTFYFILMVE